MCFNKVASFSFGSLLVGMSLWLGENGASWEYVVPPMFLAIKEFLQFYLYLALESNKNRWNRFFTILSWVHISFQPLFVNVLMSLTAHRDLKPFYYFIYVLCAVHGVFKMFTLSDLDIFTTDKSCHEVTKDNSSERANDFCSSVTSSYIGKVHVGYRFKQDNTTNIPWSPSFFSFHFLSIFPSLVLMNWRVAVMWFLFIFGSFAVFQRSTQSRKAW